MNRKQEVLNDVVIKFAGDSGDGMQLTGSQFTNKHGLMGIDLATFPDFSGRNTRPAGHPAGCERLPAAFQQRPDIYPRRMSAMCWWP